MSDFIYGKSDAIKNIQKKVERIAVSELPVFIEGETGTGKSYLAKQIHELSVRASGEFVRIDCAILASNLVESELFGHEKGSYTGATETKQGIFEKANGGTIFLEEIENLHCSLQAKLLTVLEDKTIRRVGGNKDIPVDFRLLSASNDHIENKVSQGDFRRELFYRLRGTRLNLPPLRERKEDIVGLATHFLNGCNKRNKINKKFSKDVIPYLIDYSWPGNMRELKYAVEEAAVKSEADEIQISDFSIDLDLHSSLSGRNNGLLSLAELEKRHICMVLKVVEFNKAKATKILGIGLNTLYRKIKNYDIDKI